MSSNQKQRTHRALNILAKWRTLFAGWQLGTRPKGDPECDAVRDHRELTILLRAEVSALASALIRRGVISEEQFLAALEREANQLSDAYAAKFPGVTATEQGLAIDTQKVAGWMKDWRP